MSAGISIADLIDLLRKHDLSSRVLMASQEGGFFDIGGLIAANVHLFVNAFPGSGPHDIAHLPDQSVTPAVVLLPPPEDSEP